MTNFLGRVEDSYKLLNPDYALDEDSSATIGFQGKAGSRRITEVIQGFPTQHWKSRVVLLPSKLV